MDFCKMILGREATQEEAEAIQKCQEILDSLEGEEQLSLIGVLPKPRPKQS